MSSLKLLQIEDSETDAALIRRLLHKAGYDVQETRVQTATELRSALLSESWDVVICDYTLPAFDAPTALSILRGIQPETPFIVVSGAVGEELAVTMMKAGAQDYVMKDGLSRLVPAVERELVEAGNRASRRRAEAELRRAEERLARTVENMSDGLVLHAHDGSIVQSNPAAERLLGLTADQMSGRSSLDPRWHAVHEDGSPFPGETHPAMVTLKTGEAVRDVVMGVNRSDGTRMWLKISSAQLADVKDGLPGVVVTFSDVTDSKVAGEALRRQAIELRERNEELERFNRAAVDRELRMVELKQEINRLLERLGEKRRYQSVPKPPIPGGGPTP